MLSSLPSLSALLLGALLAVPAYASGGATSSLDRGAPLETPPGVVDGATARALVDAGAVVVDVRTPQEFAAGHVPGAKNIPYDRIVERAGEIGDPATPVVLYCRSGRRSAIAIQALESLGFEKLWDLQSFSRWSEPDAGPGKAPRGPRDGGAQ